MDIADSASRVLEDPSQAQEGDWFRVRPGRPLLQRKGLATRRLEYCPVCGPTCSFSESDDVSEHLLKEHRPEDFGLSASRTQHWLDDEWAAKEVE